LHESLVTLTELLAPFVPFVTDEVHERLVRDVDGTAPDSVHLRAWPHGDRTLVDDDLSEQMRLVRRIVELGRAARAEAKVKTRQPLARALVSAPGWDRLSDELRDHVADELNVRAVETLTGDSELVEVSYKANFRVLGKSFGADTPRVAEAINAGRVTSVDGGWSVQVDGKAVSVPPDAVARTETPRSGWARGSAGGETVALDLELTPELRRAGTAREVLRLVQEARKAQGLDVVDRIELWWAAIDPDTDAALREYADAIAAEVLAVAVTANAPNAPLAAHEVPELGLTFWLRAVD
jgi:isoleucyl-tRNA synthetase